MQFRLGIKESENTAVRDTATSTEQRSDLGRLQEWHPLRTWSQCVHDWLSLSPPLCECVCVSVGRDFLKDKRAHRRGKDRKRYKVKMLTSPLLINWVIHWVVMQWKFLIKRASKKAQAAGTEEWMGSGGCGGKMARHTKILWWQEFCSLQVWGQFFFPLLEAKKKKYLPEVHHNRCRELF